MLKLLEQNGLDYDLVENSLGCMVNQPKFAKYAQILKNLCSYQGNQNRKLSLMKRQGSRRGGYGLGAQIEKGYGLF